MLVKKFSIRKLHGYKNVEIDFQNKAKIIVAENGVGKTTILNALNAMLTFRFKRLSAINFESIEVVFFNDEVVSIFKDNLNDYSGVAEDLADQLSSESGVSSNEIINFVSREYKKHDSSSVQSSKLFRAIYLNSPHSNDVVIEKLNSISSAFEAEDNGLNLARDAIKKNLVDVEIVFLPTYRRVELPLIRAPRHRRKMSGLGAIYPRQIGQFDAKYNGMNFGLADVEDKLNELADIVEKRSNFEYRQVSARMVKELLRGQITRADAEQYPLPDSVALQMLL